MDCFQRCIALFLVINYFARSNIFVHAMNNSGERAPYLDSEINDKQLYDPKCNQIPECLVFVWYQHKFSNVPGTYCPLLCLYEETLPHNYMFCGIIDDQNLGYISSGSAASKPQVMLLSLFTADQHSNPQEGKHGVSMATQFRQASLLSVGKTDIALVKTFRVLFINITGFEGTCFAVTLPWYVTRFFSLRIFI